MRILVLGAGFGGLELSTLLSEELGANADVTLIDKAEGFVFGFSKLDVMFSHAEAGGVLHPYADIAAPGVQFVQATIRGIDPATRTVETDAGTFQGDIMVVALGADLDPAATPGLLDAGHEFYTAAGAFALRDTLDAFQGGHVVIGVTSTPFKCPPGPSEAALLTHDFLTRRGLREQSAVTLVMPFGLPVPPSPEASQALLAAFAEHGITFVPKNLVRGLDPARQVAQLSDGNELAFDLFLGVPKHTVPEVVAASGLADDGWIAVDPRTLQTPFADVYAVGDATNAATPRAGVFAEGQAAVVAHAIIDRHHGREPQRAYDGKGKCYLEFGDHRVAQVDVTFAPGEAPHGTLEGPSRELMANKVDFGATRIRRWFGNEWLVR